MECKNPKGQSDNKFGISSNSVPRRRNTETTS